MLEELSKKSFVEQEEKILSFWGDQQVFERSVEERRENPLFSFYDGPPFATGLPHYGHLLAGTIKDVVQRYKTMKGYHVPRRFGWDCHGLPVENEIEKAHNLSGAAAIDAFGIARFNDECRKIVLRYSGEWEGTVKRMGRWVDFKDTYRTMDLPFMETVWWVFKQLYDKGLVYEGFKVMPFSAKLGTPLSNFEAGQNYQDIDDPAIVVTFPLVDDSTTSLLAWTTTPWTLVSNLALAVGPSIEYVKVCDEKAGKFYILAKERMPQYFSGEGYTVVETFDGQKLAGKRYRPIFSYFADRQAQGAFRVITADFVSTEDGVGIVHCAPAFGEEDFFACLKEGIDIVCPVDSNGKFTDEIPEHAGLFVKDADKDIIKRLKSEGRLFHQATCRHRYPFCWRSDTPLIYKAVRTWFVAVEKIKDRLLAANAQIHWTPNHLKEGRFGKWLEGARDWAISRNRYWGTPIPLWRSDDGELLAIGSIADLEKLSESKVTDLHRQHIDDLVIRKGDKEFRRIPEVFDCWFESGSMPYAQQHYPFENAENFEKYFPADFIAEGLDQTRGWFYTLTVLAAALFDKPAFKNVIVNGIILAEDGTKMSKRLKNYPDPQLMIQKYGADAIRLYMLNSPAVRADDLCFSPAGVELVLRQVLIPLWNAYSFFITYARLYNWKPGKVPAKKADAVIDRWMVSLQQKLVQDVQQGMDDYDLSRAVEPFVDFVEQLTNWYIRRSRRRFWQDQATPDREEAFQTLYGVLLELTKIAAPFVPFMCEAIYRNLRDEQMPISVHLCDFPSYNAAKRDEALEQAMAAAQEAVSLGHALRKEHKLKVRQPLASVHLASGSAATLQFLREQQHLIADELNVKDVRISSDETELVSLKAKPNFRLLGKKVGKLMKAVQIAIDAFEQDQLQQLMDGKEVVIVVEGEQITLTPEDVVVERTVKPGMVAANSGHLALALDTELTEDLLIEGLARELVNKINSMRREADFAISDRIAIRLQTTDRVKKCFEQWGDYIRGEVLATEVLFQSCQGTELDLNGEPTTIALEKV